MMKYQEDKKKDMAIEKDWRQNKSVESEKIKPAKKTSEVEEEKEITEESVLACDQCNYRCTRTKTLAKHMETKHKMSNIFRCEYCNKDHVSRNGIKDCIKLQNEEFEEQKLKDIESFESIEKLLKECERDMIDYDDNAELESNSEN